MEAIVKRIDMISPWQATLLICLSCVAFGLLPVVVRIGISMGLPAEVLALYRFSIPFLCMLPFLRFPKGAGREALAFLAVAAFIGFGMMMYFRTLESVPVANAALVYMTYPMFTLLFARVFLAQPLTAKTAVAVLLVLTGSAIAFSPESLTADQMLALVPAFLAPIGFGIGIIVLTGYRRRLDTFQTLAWSSLGTMLVLVPKTLLTVDGPILPASSEALALLLAIGFGTALIPQLVYVKFASKAGPRATAIAGTMELPTAMILAWAVFHEPFGLAETTAAILILTALLFCQPGPERTAEPAIAPKNN